METRNSLVRSLLLLLMSCSIVLPVLDYKNPGDFPQATSSLEFSSQNAEIVLPDYFSKPKQAEVAPNRAAPGIINGSTALKTIPHEDNRTQSNPIIICVCRVFSQALESNNRRRAAWADGP
ncbi:MAG: hypothetical protein ACXACI_08740 [Candidatus Hodarchaeales archaeon]